MNARFVGASSRALHDRGLFAILGEVVDGNPRTGQIATGASGFCRRVHGVEPLRLTDGDQALALLFVSAENDLAEWTALELIGGEITLLDSP